MEKKLLGLGYNFHLIFSFILPTSVVIISCSGYHIFFFLWKRSAENFLDYQNYV